MAFTTIADFIKYDYLYDLLLAWRDSEKTEDMDAMQELLGKLGLWANTPEQTSKFLTPFDENRRSFILKAPDGWKMGDFPTPGEYSFAMVEKKGTGPRESEIDYVVYELRPQGGTLIHDYTAGYLFTFLEEKKKLRLHNYSIIKDQSSPYYEKSLRMQVREEEIRQACIEYIPELAHYAWADELEISGKWQEKDRNDPEFFKKTFEMVTGDYYQQLGSWSFPFEPLIWENHSSKITTEITYRAVDENALRNYGIEKKVDYTEEVGIWLQEEEDYIKFEGKFKIGNSSFTQFQGKLYSDRITMTIPFLWKNPAGKKEIEAYFGKWDLVVGC